MFPFMPPKNIKKPSVFCWYKMRILAKNGISTASLNYVTAIKVVFVKKTWNGVIASTSEYVANSVNNFWSGYTVTHPHEIQCSKLFIISGYFLKLVLLAFFIRFL